MRSHRELPGLGPGLLTANSHGPCCRPLRASQPRRQALPCVAVAQPQPLRRMGDSGGGGGAQPGGAGGGNGASPSASASSASVGSTALFPTEPAAQRPWQEPSGERPRAPPGAAPATGDADAEAARRRASLLPVAFVDGRVTVGDGTLLLDRVSPQARVQHPAPDTGMVVLSMAATKGPTAMEDFPLGQVRCAGGWVGGEESKPWRGMLRGGRLCMLPLLWT